MVPPISPPPGLLGLVDERFKISPPPWPPKQPPVAPMPSPPAPKWDGEDNGHLVATNATGELINEQMDFDDGGRLHKDARQQLVEDATSVNEDTQVRALTLGFPLEG